MNEMASVDPIAIKLACQPFPSEGNCIGFLMGLTQINRLFESEASLMLATLLHEFPRDGICIGFLIGAWLKLVEITGTLDKELLRFSFDLIVSE